MTQKQNYRINARQRTFVTSNLDLCFGLMKIDEGLIEKAINEGYLHLPETDEYIDVVKTNSTAMADDQIKCMLWNPVK